MLVDTLGRPLRADAALADKAFDSNALRGIIAGESLGNSLFMPQEIPDIPGHIRGALFRCKGRLETDRLGRPKAPTRYLTKENFTCDSFSHYRHLGARGRICNVASSHHVECRRSCCWHRVYRDCLNRDLCPRCRAASPRPQPPPSPACPSWRTGAPRAPDRALDVVFQEVVHAFARRSSPPSSAALRPARR